MAALDVTGTLQPLCRKGQELPATYVLRLERSLHGRNVENNLKSDGQSILKLPEVHDWHIEAATSALDGPVTSADHCDPVGAIDNALDSHMVF
jgi:hypothetical protein